MKFHCRHLPIRQISLLIFFPLLFSSCSSTIQQETEKNETSTEWISLFNGSDMQNWRGFQSDSLPAGWHVSDSLLITSGAGGDLGGDIISREQYEDFRLELEWKISEGGNSGIFFHVIEGDNPTVYASGPEYQLIDDIGFEYPLEDWQQTGANYAVHPADTNTKHIRPAGTWNHSAIEVLNGKVTHWLNGEKVVEYTLWDDAWKKLVGQSKWKDYPNYGTAVKGHIGLQDHGSEIAFRNIRIKDLTDKGKAVFNGKDLSGWSIYGTEKWYVENGELVCESGPDKQYGYLATDNNYKDFILRLQFLQEADGNSGVFFRSSIEGTRISGWQAEVAPPGNNTGGIYESYGRGWLAEIPDEKENILLPGQWNEMIIRAEGERVMIWLNGQLMTDLRDEKIGGGKGSIALQIHDGGGIKVRWKEMYIRELNQDNK